MTTKSLRARKQQFSEWTAKLNRWEIPKELATLAEAIDARLAARTDKRDTIRILYDVFCHLSSMKAASRRARSGKGKS